MLMPGVTMLGRRKQKGRLLRDARQEGVDVLLTFVVNVKPLRKGGETTDTAMEIWDVVNGKQLITFRAINNVKIERIREEGRDDDPIDAKIAQFTNFVDKNLVLARLPKGIKPNGALKRAKKLAGGLASGRYAKPLPVLTEIRFYHLKKLISGEDLAALYGTSIGENEGKQLASGTADQKKAVLTKWLPGVRKRRERL